MGQWWACQWAPQGEEHALSACGGGVRRGGEPAGQASGAGEVRGQPPGATGLGRGIGKEAEAQEIGPGERN